MTAIIDAAGLTKRFGDVTALNGLDLVAQSGHITTLLGPQRRRQDHLRTCGRDPAAAR
jgi:ABC-type branched-subunit amino acid transport system ATPase component